MYVTNMPVLLVETSNPSQVNQAQLFQQMPHGCHMINSEKASVPL